MIDKTILPKDPKGRKVTPKVIENPPKLIEDGDLCVEGSNLDHRAEKEKLSEQGELGKGVRKEKEGGDSSIENEQRLREEREALAHAPFPHCLAKPRSLL